MMLFDLEWKAEIDRQLRALTERIEALERRVTEIDEGEPPVVYTLEFLQWQVQQLVDFMERIEAEQQ